MRPTVAFFQCLLRKDGKPGAAGMLLLCVGMTTACDSFVGKAYPPYRYRLSVQVNTPHGTRVGSSVIEIRTHLDGSLNIDNPGGQSREAVGQGIAIPLPNGETLFTLTRSDDSYDWLNTLLLPFIQPASRPEAKSRAGKNASADRIEMAIADLTMERLQALKGSFVLPRWHRSPFPQNPPLSGWPMMVRFRDLHDAKSIEKVDPDNLPASFGKGYSIRQIAVQRTDAPITGGITAKLPRPDAKGFYNWDGRSNPSDPANFAYSVVEFSRGVTP